MIEEYTAMIWAYLAHLSFNMWEEADALYAEAEVPGAGRWTDHGRDSGSG